MVLAVSMIPGILLNVLLYCIVFLIGITLFSYLNIVIEVLPEEISRDEKKDRLVKGRSTCPHCGHRFEIKEAIPVFSWFYYRKKCMYCLEPISMRHTLIELFGGVLAIVVVAYYHVSFAALTVFLLFSLLATISIIDWDTQYIPPELNLMIAILGIIAYWTLPGTSIIEKVIGAACISVPLIIVVMIIPEGFGWGDIKLMAAAGLFLGWKATLIAFFIGLLIGGAYGVYVLVTKKMSLREHFAFGPCLSVGIAIATYAGIGTRLMQAYLDMLRTIGKA